MVSGFRVQGVGCRVKCVVCMVYGADFMVLGLGVKD